MSELVRKALEEEGVKVLSGRKVTKVRRNGERTVATLDDGTEIETDVVVVAAGRTPRTQGIGLESLGVEPDGKGLPINDHCRIERAGEGAWAVGDVAGVQLFTHVAQY